MRAAEIEFRNATKRYPGRSAPAVSGLTLRVAPGELCVLVGPSGGGKTTAMKMVNRLVELDEGDVLVDGRSVRDLGGDFASTVNAVSALLTEEAIIAMNSAVAIDQQDPAEVASEFLEANGLK